jgi:hypothetical protein
MENRTFIPDLAQMGMTMDFKFVLPIDATFHDSNEGINLVLGEGGLKCDFGKFKLGTSLDRFPWPFHGCSLGDLDFVPTSLIFFERNDFGRPFGVGVILNLDIASQGFGLRFVGIAGMLFYVNPTKFRDD